ncbi:hypothetical protein [Pedobacter insulae]|uniref:Uncharacterized protein n=1 Tax=Pedobacter insulae TaxID=414048 RepID=A0A1I2Y2P9_9SPHI|nr:hypothetical protein [Pedobacter insulae]SFH20048.1 hypothetical protein SAMN04489864_106195 [Pedobacter insulae]
MQKFTLSLKKSVFFSICLVFLICVGFQGTEESIQNTLTKYYDSTSDGNALKRYEFNVTNTGFCKCKKVYTNGKTEFFSFNLSRFKSIEYYGNDRRGELHLYTNGDDVIVQTHNDRKGDIDSMATKMVIPLKEVDQYILNNLADQFKQVNIALAKK